MLEKKIIGIKIRTTNENGQAAGDIGSLWHRFLSEGIVNQIPNKTSGAVYSVYTEYESDYTKPYSVLLGCEVNTLAEVPEGMDSIIIKEGPFKKFTSKGNIVETWGKIWNTDLDRAYTADFERYETIEGNPAESSAEIFIALNK